MEARLKGIIRQFSRIEYTKTSLSEDYIKLEEKYRVIRDFLYIFEANLEKLMTYEHGGKVYKNMMQTLEVIGDRINLKAFKADTFYEQGGIILDAISKVHANESLNKASSNLSTAMLTIKNAKNTMNERIESILVDLHKLQNNSKLIDKDRNNLKNIRFDLERHLKKYGSEDEKGSDLSKKFNFLVEDTEKRMDSFVNGMGLDEIVKNVAKAERDFHKSSYEALKNIQ